MRKAYIPVMGLYLSLLIFRTGMMTITNQIEFWAEGWMLTLDSILAVLLAVSRYKPSIVS